MNNPPPATSGPAEVTDQPSDPVQAELEALRAILAALNGEVSHLTEFLNWHCTDLRQLRERLEDLLSVVAAENEGEALVSGLRLVPVDQTKPR